MTQLVTEGTSQMTTKRQEHRAVNLFNLSLTGAVDRSDIEEQICVEHSIVT